MITYVLWEILEQILKSELLLKYKNESGYLFVLQHSNYFLLHS
jgi:hypothetical protein